MLERLFYKHGHFFELSPFVQFALQNILAAKSNATLYFGQFLTYFLRGLTLQLSNMGLSLCEWIEEKPFVQALTLVRRS